MGGVDKLNELAEIVAQARRDCAKQGKKAFREACADLFASHPGLGKFGWTQYTPYFNDGEPCVFSVGDLCMFSCDGMPTSTLSEDEEEDEDDYFSGPWRERATGEWRYADGWSESALLALEACKEIVDALGNMEETAMLAFGDHVKVIVRRGEGDTVVEVEEYDHD